MANPDIVGKEIVYARFICPGCGRIKEIHEEVYPSAFTCGMCHFSMLRQQRQRVRSLLVSYPCTVAETVVNGNRNQA